MIGLEKLSTLSLEGSGPIFRSLFLKGEMLSSDKKLVSLHTGVFGKGRRFSDKISLDRRGKLRTQLKREVGCGGPRIVEVGFPNQFCSRSRQ